MDTLISGATVYDGLVVEPKQRDIGLVGDRIAYVGPALSRSAATHVIDARGLYLCPGFIDTHASTGFGYRLPNAGDHKLYQGVTTEIIGNCGASPGPIGAQLVEDTEALANRIGFIFDWQTLGEWFERVEAHGLPLNVGTYAGHNTLRRGVSGDATESDVDAMARALDTAIQHGALGLSTGLVYAPGSFATIDEIVALARISANGGGLYASHIRSERAELEAAIDEAIEIGRRSGCPVLVSHLKAAERPNWGKIPDAIRRIELARSKGQSITFEVYPYTAVSTTLRTYIPYEALADGVEGLTDRLATDEWRSRCVSWLREQENDFDGMVLVTESVPGARGRSVLEIAKRAGVDSAHQVVDLLLADPETWIVNHCIDPADMDAAILWPDSIICSDSWSYPVNAPNSIGDPHPRTYGAFTRFLEHYALREARMPFGQAVRKITSIPADWLGLYDRGRIAEGAYADLVLLDPAEVHERATYTEPRQLSRGTRYVMGERHFCDRGGGTHFGAAAGPNRAATSAWLSNESTLSTLDYGLLFSVAALTEPPACVTLNTRYCQQGHWYLSKRRHTPCS